MRSVLLMVGSVAFSLVAGGGLPACSRACTMEARGSFAVAVKDARTQSLICDAEVVWSDSSLMERAPPSVGEPSCRYEGPSERSGHFVIRVAHAGYVTQSVEITISETEDECHVVGQGVTVALDPG